MKTVFATLILAIAIASPALAQRAAGLPAKRLLQRLPAERVVPHRRVVTFNQLLENCEGADGSSAPSQRCTGPPAIVTTCRPQRRASNRSRAL